MGLLKIGKKLGKAAREKFEEEKSIREQARKIGLEERKKQAAIVARKKQQIAAQAKVKRLKERYNRPKKKNPSVSDILGNRPSKKIDVVGF